MDKRTSEFYERLKVSAEGLKDDQIQMIINYTKWVIIENINEKFIEIRRPNKQNIPLDVSSVAYARDHSVAPDRETPEWIIMDFRAGYKQAIEDVLNLKKTFKTTDVSIECIATSEIRKLKP